MQSGASAGAGPGFETPRPMDGLPCPWLRLSPAGVIEACNSAFSALLGVAAARLHQSAFDAWLSPPSRVMYQSLVQPLLKLHGHVSELALTLQAPGGGTTDVLFYAAREGVEPSSAVAVQLAPIRQRRRIEAELLRVKRAADQAPGMIFQLERIDETLWRFPYANEAIRTLYGTTAEAAAQSAEVVLRQIHPEDRQQLLAQLTVAAAQGTPFRVLVRVGETPRWHEFEGVVRQRAGGAPLWHGHVADVSERIALQEGLIQRQALERLARARSEFIARVSHELRTPLNGILGFAQLLVSDAELPLAPRQAERMAVVLGSGRHLLGVVDELLEISRIEAGQLSLALQPVVLGPVLAQVLEVLDGDSRARALDITLRVDDPACAVQAEPQRLRQVLLNLVSNAVKYNRAGGQVRVQAAPVGAEVRIDVVDTGPGLSDAQQAALFQPFNRLGAERTAVEGTGLGLVISRHLVQLMGGRLEVASRPGAGSTFTVWLPHEPPAAVPPPGTAAAASPEPAGGGHVLYVEDNPVNVLVMQAMLARRPAVTLNVAVDAAAALRCVRQCRPALLLIDMHLPDATGLELLQLLRREPGLDAVPAIVVSASAEPEAQAQARAQGFDAYWTKPLDLDTTLAQLDRWLQPVPPPR
jgi:signal transduction histidine kinase/ActR/RegA family two-component response regulator